MYETHVNQVMGLGGKAIVAGIAVSLVTTSGCTVTRGRRRGGCLCRHQGPLRQADLVDLG